MDYYFVWWGIGYCISHLIIKWPFAIFFLPPDKTRKDVHLSFFFTSAALTSIIIIVFLFFLNLLFFFSLLLYSLAPSINSLSHVSSAQSVSRFPLEHRTLRGFKPVDQQ